MSEPRKKVLADGVEIWLGDCREVLPLIGKVDAVVTDPPYFGVKKDDWDNQWKNVGDFISFIEDVVGMVHSILVPNGSLYHFASPQMASRVERAISTRFNILNNIVWDKGVSRKGSAGKGIDVGALRSFWSASSERIIFAEPLCRLTYSECDEAAAKASGYWDACQKAKASVIGDYLRSEFSLAGVSSKQIAALFPSKTGGLTGCVSNWLLGHNIPTEDQYNAIRAFLNEKGVHYLRREYEDLRRPFILTPADEWGDVWRFAIAARRPF